MKNTMTAVPWTALGHDPAEAAQIPVAQFIDQKLLDVGDTIHAMNEQGTYEQWTLEDGVVAVEGAVENAVNGWRAAAATIIEGENGGSLRAVTPQASDRGLQRGSAVWVTRPTNSAKPFFLIGQYSGEDMTVSIAGATGARKRGTMVPNPYITAFPVNSYDWGNNPSADDVITLPAVGNLRWDATKKVWWRTVQTRDPKTRKPVKSIKTDDVIPAGQGFWYYRAGETPINLSIPGRSLDD